MESITTSMLFQVLFKFIWSPVKRTDMIKPSEGFASDPSPYSDLVWKRFILRYLNTVALRYFLVIFLFIKIVIIMNLWIGGLGLLMHGGKFNLCNPWTSVICYLVPIVALCLVEKNINFSIAIFTCSNSISWESCEASSSISFGQNDSSQVVKSRGRSSGRSR